MYEKKEGSSTIFHLLEAFLFSCRLPGISFRPTLTEQLKENF